MLTEFTIRIVKNHNNVQKGADFGKKYAENMMRNAERAAATAAALREEMPHQIDQYHGLLQDQLNVEIEPMKLHLSHLDKYKSEEEEEEDVGDKSEE